MNLAKILASMGAPDLRSESVEHLATAVEMMFEDMTPDRWEKFKQRWWAYRATEDFRRRGCPRPANRLMLN